MFYQLVLSCTEAWLFRQARKVIGELADHAVRYDSDGIDVVFLNSKHADKSNVKVGTISLTIFF